jgi:hypothetical protein
VLLYIRIIIILFIIYYGVLGVAAFLSQFIQETDFKKASFFIAIGFIVQFIGYFLWILTRG